MLEYRLMQISVLLILIYLFGLFYAIPMLFLVTVLSDRLLDSFGYTRVTYFDLLFSYDYMIKSFQVSGYMEIDKIDYEEFKDVFVVRALTKFRKLRRIIINKFGVQLWKDICIADAIDQIIKDETKLGSHEEVMEYLTQINDQKTDWTKPLWEFRVVENYTEDTSLLIYKFHHSLMDAVGFASLMSCVNDNQFASKLNKKFEQPPLMVHLKAMVNAVKLFVNTLTSKVISFSDESAIKITETTTDDKYPNRFFVSKEYDFSKITKGYKQFPNMTFNDFMVCIFGKSLHQLYKEYGIEDAKQLGIFILINMRPLPTKYEEVYLDNYFITSPFGVPLSDDINSIFNSIKSVTDILKSQEVVYTSYYFCHLILALVPKIP